MFDREQKSDAFDSYESYMEYLFACVNEAINRYLQRLKEIYATGQGDYKNVLYPDLEIAHDTCKEKLGQFRMRGEERQGAEKAEETEEAKGTKDGQESFDPALLELFGEINQNGQTILMVTHSVKAASHAGRVMFIKDGEVFHQIYRGNSTDEQLYQKISDTLTALASKKFQGGEGR